MNLKRKLKHHKRTLLKRHGHHCQYCGGEDNLTLDHKIPKWAGGSRGGIGNLQIACSTCNGLKGGWVIGFHGGVEMRLSGFVEQRFTKVI